MRKQMILLLMCCLLLGGCSALPAEDRSFAVALGVSHAAGVWEVSARIPSYQTGGGYLTLSAQGASLQEALAVLDAAAPMRMHYGQVRLLIFTRTLAESPEFPAVLDDLARRPDMRLQAQVCVTEDALPAFMDALEPQTGARLSKSLDILLETRRKLGVIPEASLSGILRMGERQCPVLLSAALEKDETLRQGGMDAQSGAQAVQGAGKLQFSGSWLTNSGGAVKGSLSPGETQLLTLMQNELRKTTMAVGDGTLTISDASSSLKLDGNHVLCRLKVRYTSSDLTEEGIVRELRKDILALTDKLAAAGCDALGLGGYAIRHFSSMAAWTALDWPALYPQLRWEIETTLHPPA